ILRRGLAAALKARWPGEDFGPREPPAAPNGGALVELQQQILHLAPRGDAQKWLQSQTLQLTSELARSRWLLAAQESAYGLPVPMVVILVAWTTAIFISFGLFVKANATVVIALSVSALSVACAMFLVLELSDPFGGLLQISSAPAHALLATMNQ